MTVMDSPPQSHDDAVLRAQAIVRLRRRQGFQIHRNVYLAASVLMVMIWLAVGIGAGAWFPWPVFPIAGWGIGVFFHKQAVDGWRLKEADIQDEMKRLRGES